MNGFLLFAIILFIFLAYIAIYAICRILSYCSRYDEKVHEDEQDNNE